MSRLILAATVLLVGGSSAIADITVIDFSSLTKAGTPMTQVDDGYAEDGFELRATYQGEPYPYFGSWPTEGVAYTGSVVPAPGAAMLVLIGLGMISRLKRHLV